MKNQNAPELVKNDIQISDKSLIAKLKYELEECQASNIKLQGIAQRQSAIIDRQQKTIEMSIETTNEAITTIQQRDIHIKNQDRIINSLNDGKTDLKAIWQN